MPLLKDGSKLFHMSSLSLAQSQVHCVKVLKEMYSTRVHMKKRPVSAAVVTHLLLFSHIWLFCDPMGCSPPGYSVHGIFQAKILEWVAISFSRRSSRTRDQTWVSCIDRQILYSWTTIGIKEVASPVSLNLNILWSKHYHEKHLYLN